MANRQEVLEAIAVLTAQFPAFAAKRDHESIDLMATAYHRVLVDIPSPLLAQALDVIGAENDFFPSAHELRKACLSIRHQAEGIPSAQDAWAEVTRQLRKGLYAVDPRGFRTQRAPTPDDWSHPLIQRAIDGVGGWIALRTSENTVADRARFIEAYESYLNRHVESRDMLPQIRAAIEQARQIGKGGPISLEALGRALNDDRELLPEGEPL